MITSILAITFIICRSGESNLKRITQDDDYVQLRKIDQRFREEKIKISISAGHKNFKFCHDNSKDLVYIWTWSNKTDKKQESILYVVDLVDQGFYHIKNSQIKNNMVVESMLCSSGILIFTLVNQRGIWTRDHTKDEMFFDKIGNVHEVFISPYDPKSISLITEQNKIYLLNLTINKWSLLFENSTNPQW
ncbi:hypothetical protein RF11_08926 [Thelohanellus kitauei]|uniref:Uncharacterized protein n=1 Tax=Thelohanellus kitauei TaxID=669202 RepID=A0A0C2J0Z5_THEKT|nr:hypothetical protein RF11_08926 [Thelohanellus kitauei]